MTQYISLLPPCPTCGRDGFKLQFIPPELRTFWQRFFGAKFKRVLCHDCGGTGMIQKAQLDRVRPVPPSAPPLPISCPPPRKRLPDQTVHVYHHYPKPKQPE